MNSTNMTEFSNLGVLQTHKTNVCFNFYQDQILKIFEYHSIFIKALESAGKGQPARFFFIVLFIQCSPFDFQNKTGGCI